MLIATTAAVSLLLVGLMVVSMTPERTGSPETASSTSAGAARSTPAALQRPGLPVVTPLGAHGLAVTTLGAVDGVEGRLRARLPDGAIHMVTLLATDADTGLAVVELPAAARVDGYDLADEEPAPSDTVLVNGRPPVVVPMADLADLDVEEGTPVLDGDGNLVGLCTGAGGQVALTEVPTVPTAPPTTVPPVTAPPTTVRPPTTPPTTTVPPTTPPTTAPPVTTAQVPTSVPPTVLSGGAVATTAPG